ncbi:MAG: TIGR03960 family B12-binding radical SAM protein [Clostridia bacterium]|nr:TIGR03960 family B12-binding radical SAM protein [Christensenellaceae bacterium]MBR6239676.1 TIGR03960 family B12-binding radical SAM protein [Clostridia bacterium]
MLISFREENLLIDLDKLSSILPKVEKPGRYIGGERGRIKKEDYELHFLFAFPDVYEVGMSNLGIQILYDIANKRSDTFAEETFCPFPDMYGLMKENGIPLYSLETFTPAREFDMIGFNLSYEMCYTTVLSMLKLAEIPLRSADREGFPIVFAGGTCTYSPEPLADFMDAFIIGEGEEVNNEFMDLYLKHKRSGSFDRRAFLKEAAAIPGVYVPSEYQFTYNDDGTVKNITGPQLPVRKRFVTDFSNAPFPVKPVVPFLQTVFDRATLEIFRGCTRGCRFCQAGYVYRPNRERDRDVLLKQACEIIDNSGYDEVSLSSLSSGDYSEINELVIGLLDTLGEKGVSVSLPSLRIDSFKEEYSKRMQSARKGSFTFAPEAGTQRLRDVINKNITEEDIERGVRYAFESGTTTIKLYFMIGLPTETYEDLDGIADIVRKIIGIFYDVPKELRKGSLKITVSTSSFVPKPMTPFQWEPQNTIEELRKKQDYLKEKLKIRGVTYNYHDSRLSFLESVFAVGDRRLGSVLEYTADRGAMFDSWQDYFRYDLYMEAFEKTGIDPYFYANRRRSPDEVLPWSHIDCLISKEYFLNELEQAYGGKTTPDCREGCNGCGMMKQCYALGNIRKKM